MRRDALIAVAALVALLALAPPASAHAVLEATSPERAAQLHDPPAQVVFRFDEPVEGSFGAVRVFDARSRRVDSGPVFRPRGDSHSVAIRLRAGLREGQYVATYRVISADSHPVSGGFVFTVGHAGTAAAPGVADVVGGGAGPVTEAAFGIARGVTYAASAVLVGGLAFLLLVLRGAAPDGLGDAARRRARRLAQGAAGAGVVAGAAGIFLQGATASATTFWSALDPGVAGEVLDTRFGRVWGLRILAFGALGVVAGLTSRARGAAPVALPGRPQLHAGFAAPVGGSALATVAAIAASFVVLAPAIGGHAAATSPAGVLVPLDVVHVAAMSVWLGGLTWLLVVVPAATRALDRPQRTRLLAGVLLRFSPLALACVVALVATGVVQSIVHLSAFGDLTGTAFGRAILVKASLLVGLIGLGVVQRRRVIPGLRGLVEAGAAPGGAGQLLRTVVRAELAVGLAVLAVTSALVAYPPPQATASGPWSATQRIGPMQLEATLDPARVGGNELHLYLLDARTGAPDDHTKELRVAASLPEKRIGPIAADARKAGPGHYVVNGLQLIPGGDWKLTIGARVSDFDEYSTTLSPNVR